MNRVSPPASPVRMFDHGPDLAVILTVLREQPDDGHRWLALASWLWDNGRDDEAAVVCVFWPTLRDNVPVSGETLRLVARNSARLGQRALQIEGRADQDRLTAED